MKSKWDKRFEKIVCSPDFYTACIVLPLSIIILSNTPLTQVKLLWRDILKTNMMIVVGMFGWLLTALAVLYAVQSKTVREYLGKKRTDLLEYIVWMFKYEALVMLVSVGYNYFLWLIPGFTKGAIILLSISITLVAYILVGIFLLMRFLLNYWKADLKTSGDNKE